MRDETSEFERVTSRLLRDIAATVGPAHRAAVLRRAAELEALELAAAEDKLVDDVQQLLHDERVDTTWPTCPRHGTHPLWYRGGVWWCERERVAVATPRRPVSGQRPTIVKVILASLQMIFLSLNSWIWASL